MDAPQADTVLSVSVVEEGPLAVELRVVSKATGCRSVSRSVRLLAGQPWVEISNVVDKLPLVEKDGHSFWLCLQSAGLKDPCRYSLGSDGSGKGPVAAGTVTGLRCSGGWTYRMRLMA